MRSTFLSLIALSHAAVVTETAYNTFYVTAGANGVTTSPSSAPASEPAPTTSEEPNNYDYQQSSSESSAPAPTTSSESPAPAPTTSSSSSSYVAPTTSSSSSSSSTSVAPPTTSSSSTTAAPTTSSAPSTTSSAPSSTTSSSEPTNSLASEIVDYHNKVRSEHGVGSLSWSDKLAGYAQDYLSGDNCVFKHSGGPYGENIAIGYPEIEDALDAWYNEKDEYDYSSGQFSESTGHFTQMVWKSTTEVGCATQECSGGTFLVCEYSPRGNFLGQFTSNVFQ